MDSFHEGEPNSNSSTNEQAVNKAIQFTENQIIEAATLGVSPQEAVQLGVNLVFYEHQSNVLFLRSLDKDQTIKQYGGRQNRIYESAAKSSVETGRLLESLQSEPNLSGIRSYLLTQGEVRRLLGESSERSTQTDSGEVSERMKKELALAEALTKVAEAIPDSGIMVEKPALFAWMDPRFSGENNPSSEY